MDEIDRTMLNIIEGIVTARGNFFDAPTLRTLNWHDRTAIVSRYITSDILLVEVANRVYASNIQLRNAATVLITLTGPNNTFTDPVTVTASPAQITAALEDIADITGNCSICQEAVTGSATRIRHCRHIHHRSCLDSWLAMSVRCPVCRHDIRDLANQTSVVSSQTSSQSGAQSEEH